mmetsp:Transcript_96266/g.214466  ORF Transcript_96266/g.214466 Transcript_96266/m.214466 type:complete len:393 (+) Transcript_96266:109-1287(+)
MGARKDADALKGFCEEDMADVLELLVKRGLEKKVLRGRAVECLKIVCSCPDWVRVAQGRSSVLCSVKELLADSPETLVKVDTPVVASADESVVTPRLDAPEGLEERRDAKQQLAVGRDVMRHFGWEFPHDPLGTKLDTATEGFMRFLDGVTLLTRGGKASSKDFDASVLDDFEGQWPDILRFLLSMHESGTRNTYRSRIKFVVLKLKELSPGFRTAAASLSLPWTITPVADSAPAAFPASMEAEADVDPTPSADSPKPGVVWIDIKQEAFQRSSLNTEDGICFRGFHDDPASPAFEPREQWLAYIQERVEDPRGRVAVVILNRRQLPSVFEIRDFCEGLGHAPPKFVVCTRGAPEEFAEWGIDASFVTQDWGKAAAIAMEEVIGCAGGHCTA